MSESKQYVPTPMGKKKKIGVITVGIFVILLIVGLTAELSTGLNLLTGEKTSVNDKSSQADTGSQSIQQYDEQTTVWLEKTSDCGRTYGNPDTGFSSSESQLAWNECVTQANIWYMENLR